MDPELLLEIVRLSLGLTHSNLVLGLLIEDRDWLPRQIAARQSSIFIYG